jgi:hypothetical protein
VGRDISMRAPSVQKFNMGANTQICEQYPRTPLRSHDLQFTCWHYPLLTLPHMVLATEDPPTGLLTLTSALAVDLLIEYIHRDSFVGVYSWSGCQELLLTNMT